MKTEAIHLLSEWVGYNPSQRRAYILVGDIGVRGAEVTVEVTEGNDHYRRVMSMDMWELSHVDMPYLEAKRAIEGLSDYRAKRANNG
jgi:hypothetical protein